METNVCTNCDALKPIFIQIGSGKDEKFFCIDCCEKTTDCELCKKTVKYIQYIEHLLTQHSPEELVQKMTVNRFISENNC